jgi:MFS-type transporter involved in bile tolerance (Atg22 family)
VTLVIAAVFPVFYNQVIARDLDNAASVFAYTGAIALLLSIFAAPVIGTIADISGRRKRLLVVTTTAGSLAVCALFTTHAGGWVWASALFIIIQLCLNMSFTLYDSLLSHVSREDTRDRLSALGYGLGYIGGGLHLAVCTFLILSPATFGINFGGDAAGQAQATELATRIALFTAGIWWLVFALPLFLNVPEPAATPLKGGARQSNVVAASFSRLGDTLRHLRRYRQLLLMLVAFWLYSDGIGTIIGLATTYGSEELRLGSSTLIGALLLTQFVAFPYALMFGRIANPESKQRDFFVAFLLWTAITFPMLGALVARNEGAEVAAQLTTLGPDQYLSYSPVQALLLAVVSQAVGVVVCWLVGRRLVGGITAALTTKRAILLGLAIYATISVWAFFSNTPGEFWLLAWLVATVQGGTQALSRSLFASMTPVSKSGEFFGFYALTDKFGSIFGLLLFGFIGQATGSLRISILSVIIFFVAGGALLMMVDEKAGQRAALAEEAA